MASKYQEAQDDPELLSLHSEVALIDARLGDLLARVDTGESGAMWSTLRKEWDEFLLVRASGDIPKMHVMIGRLDALMARAIQDHLAWEEISQKIEQRRKLVDSEQKRLVTSQQMIYATEAMMLMAKLTDVVTRAVLAIPSHLPAELSELRSLVDKASKQALSGIVVELQQMMTHEGVPTYAEVQG